MILLKRVQMSVTPLLSMIFRHGSTTETAIKFTKQEQTKILDVLSGSNPTQLSRLKLSHNQIKTLQSWKCAQGTFSDLLQMLQADGLELSSTEKLCHRILAGNVLNQTTKNNFNKKQLVWPTWLVSDKKNLDTVLGIHIDTAGMSWSKLHTSGNVDEWDFYSFCSLPTKILPRDNYNLAKTILKLLPIADVYVFEMQSTKSGKALPTHLQINELNSMLYTLINVRSETLDTGVTNTIYHVRNNLSSRLFKTFVGGEKVSTIGTVRKLIERESNLPCEKVVINNLLIQQYDTVPKDSKELLGHSLLLTIAFMDIIVKRNPQSHKAIQFRDNKNN